MGFLNFGKKKKEAMPSRPFGQPTAMPPNPAQETTLPSLSDDKLDGLKLPELPDINELGSFPRDDFLPSGAAEKPWMKESLPLKQERMSPLPPSGGPIPQTPPSPPIPPVSGRGPAPASNNRMPPPNFASNKNPSFPNRNVPVPGMQAGNLRPPDFPNPRAVQSPPSLGGNSAPMHPPPVPKERGLPVQRTSGHPMRIPRKIDELMLGNLQKPNDAGSTLRAPGSPVSKKLDPLEALKATNALGKKKDPALLDDFLSDEMPESVPYEKSKHSNFSESGELFIKGEEYRSVVEAINSLASLKTDQIKTSESFNFSHSMSDKFEGTIEKIKNKIISVDELLFE